MEGLMFKIVKKFVEISKVQKKQERKMDINIETSKICSAVIFILLCRNWVI